MKDGKPEVLIIGEWHPSSVYQYVNEEIKKEEIKTALSYSATSKVIIEGEIDAIKNFGAKKLLFERPAIGGMVKICDELTGENNLLSFQKNLLKEFLQVFSEEQKTLFSLAKELGLEKEVGDGQPIFAKYTAKILTFQALKDEHGVFVGVKQETELSRKTSHQAQDMVKDETEF